MISSRLVSSHRAISSVPRGSIPSRSGTINHSILHSITRSSSPAIFRAKESTELRVKNRNTKCAASGFVPPVKSPDGKACIKIIGVGGGGNNAVHRIHDSKLQGVEIWTVNTDAQVLAKYSELNKLQIGSDLTRGLGCGGSPELGRQAALESETELRTILEGTDLVFIAAGMGGGTGTGAAPVIAKLAKEMDILTVAIATYPFTFEGQRRSSQAAEGLQKLREHADSVIMIPNQRLLELAGPDIALQDAFAMADNILLQGVQGISDIIVNPGFVNVDFADVKSVMSNSGTAMLGMGDASGADRAERAAADAINNPLITKSIERATGIVYNITGGSDMKLSEINKVSEVVTGTADPSCNIIFGSVVNDAFKDTIHVTIIATGFPPEYEEQIMLSNKPRARKPVQRSAAQ